MIKRLSIYLMLGIFLLNVLGYYAVFMGARQITSQQLTKRLNSEMHDLGGNLTIKVPLALPYEVTADHFERTGGEYEVYGQVYQVINQRHYNDTLYIVCIKDENTTRLNSIFEEYVESFAGRDDGDGQQSAPGPIKDFVSEEISLKDSGNGWEECLQLNTASTILFASFFVSIIHPPERHFA